MPASGNIIDSKDGGSLGTPAQTKGAVAMTTTEGASEDTDEEVEILESKEDLLGEDKPSHLNYDSDENDPEIVVCKHCGTKTTVSLKRCSKCGTPFSFSKSGYLLETLIASSVVGFFP